MNRGSFDKLCDTIALKVGDSVFKPENCATDEEGEEDGSSETGRRKRTCFATDALGGSLSGELKVAVMLRLLAGASYLDLLLVYGISSASVYSVFHEAIEWVLTSFQFPFLNWIVNKNKAMLNCCRSLFFGERRDFL